MKIKEMGASLHNSTFNSHTDGQSSVKKFSTTQREICSRQRKNK